jgi:hypothetical protein
LGDSGLGGEMMPITVKCEYFTVIGKRALTANAYFYCLWHLKVSDGFIFIGSVTSFLCYALTNAERVPNLINLLKIKA